MTPLDYGHRPTAGRRVLRCAIIAAFFAVAAIAGRFAADRLERHFARRTAHEQFVKWFADAHATQPRLGEGVVHSERSIWSSYTGSRVDEDGMTRRFIVPTDFEPFQRVRRDSDGLPTFYYDGVIYARVHDVSLAAGGTVRAWVAISYRGPNAAGQPRFFATTYRLSDDGQTLQLPSTDAIVTAEPGETRPLRQLEISTGRPHAGDGRRWTMPFRTQDWRGRFEFRTRVASDDRDLGAPDVWVEWDDAATQPGAADAVQR